MAHAPNPLHFGIQRFGFVPQTRPLHSFPSPYFAAWDNIISDLPNLISTKTLQNKVDQLPVLDAGKLSSDPEYHRAYVILGFTVHAFVWGTSRNEKPNGCIPPQLAEPFLQVCQHLGMQPVLSYAGLCLWNWTVKGEINGTFFDMDQLSSIGSFTGTRGEDVFYHVPVLVEVEGGRLIKWLLGAVMEARNNSWQFVEKLLRLSAPAMEAMGGHLARLYSTLDANMFYHHLRPFLAGGKDMEENGLPRGMVFQKSDGSEIQVKCVGGSAGQSSLFQFLDYVLGVEHKVSAAETESIFQEMREYMPGVHREFLQQVGELPSLRTLVEQQTGNDTLREAFNDCVHQLRSWRGKHIAVVSKYIVQPARGEVSEHHQGADAEFQVEGSELQGTGGSALIPFLRQTRDDTAGITNTKARK